MERFVKIVAGVVDRFITAVFFVHVLWDVTYDELMYTLLPV